MTARLVPLGLAALVAVLVPVLALTEVHSPVRVVAAVVFVVLVPGVPVVFALDLPDGRVTAVLAVCVSVSALLLGGAAGAVLGRWDPVGTVMVIAAVGLLATPLGLRAVLRRPVPATARGGERGKGSAGQEAAASAPPRDGSHRAHSRWPDASRLAHSRPDASRRADSRRHDASSRADFRLREAAARALPRTAGLALVAASLVLWWISTRQLDTGQAGLGGAALIAPVTYWLALAVLAGVLAWSLLRDELDHVVLAAACTTFAVCAYLFTSVADGAGGVGAGWVHVGFTDLVTRTGTFATGIDARFSWPGFLGGLSILVTAAGLPDAAALLLLGPAFYAVLAMPALWLIAKVISRNARTAWLAVALWLCFNWYQQDYLSAQATGFVLYAGVLAVLLWAFDVADVPAVRGRRALRWLRAARRIPGRPPGVGGVGMIALEVLLLLVIVALVLSHQLTPIALGAALLWFTVAGATRWRSLWLVTAALVVGWFSYGAVGFWRGHLAGLLGDLGGVGASVSSGVSERLVGDPVYQQLQFSRIGWTGLLGLVAVVGWFLMRRNKGAVLWAGLAAAPFALLGVQSYGGEVVIRCALYAGPVLAPLAAVALVRAGGAVRKAVGAQRFSARMTVAVATAFVLFVAMSVLTLTRGLNTSFEHVSAAEVDAARTLLRLAPDGATVASGGEVGPLPLGRVGEVRTVPLVPRDCDGLPPDCLRTALKDGGPDFVYVTQGQEALGRLLRMAPPGWTGELVDVALDSGDYETVVRNKEATVLRRIGGGAP
ncbi:hypothetical protein ACFWN2_04010 [Lentzea sp. NPDC058436]|uniref:hypothetical protein n=1 Tax=Lentzea sp. NPDC058436 TaxID=3346499 RepID=UPI00364FDF4B